MNKGTKQPVGKLESPSAGHSIRWYWGVAVGCLALFTLAAWVAVYLQLHGQQLELARRQVLAGVEGVAGRLTATTRLRQGLLKELCLDPGLVSAFQREDRAALAQHEQRLARLIPGALKVRLLSPGINEPDLSVTPQLGFAALAQLQWAKRHPGVSVAAVHQFGSRHAYVSLAAGVRARPDGPVVGLVHLALSMDDLRAAMDSVKDYGSRVELRQQAPDAAPFTLIRKGGAGEPQTPPTGTLAIPGSIWRLAYWVDPSHLVGVQPLLMLSLPGALLVLLAAGLLLYLAERMRKALRRDQHNILSLVESLFVGRLPKPQPAQLTDLQPTLEVLQHQIKTYRLKMNELQKGRKSFPAPLDATAGFTVQEGMAPAVTAVSHEDVELSASIFRAYDIRGVVGETLTPDVVNLLGQGIGSEIFEKGYSSVVVGRDGRDSSEGLQSALIAGLQASGREVIDVGLVPTPVLYFAAQALQVDCGVMVTGSHNPKEYNGLKIIENGQSLTPEAIQDLRRRIDSGQLLLGEGSFDSREIVPDYIERIVSDIRLARPMKLVIDCGNGAGGVVAGELYRQLGCEVVELFCEVDGSFPNHHPDPSQPENMQALQQAVLDHQADLGLAFDGDADRIGVIDSSGKLIWPDRLLMYLAIDVLTREPGGDIIYDVKCSRNLANVVLSNGGRPLMWKSGHSLLKTKMRETHALLAGEFSGHIIFSERWYGFDDGLYTGARLLEILALDYRSSAEAFAELPESLATPEYVLPLPEGRNFELMEALEKLPEPANARVVKIDGLRAEFEQGWGLVRASNTMPALLFRFEADSETGMEQVKGIFRDMLKQVDADLTPPF